MLTTSARAYEPRSVLVPQGKLLVVNQCKFNPLSCLAKGCLTLAATPFHIHWVVSLMALRPFPGAQRRFCKILLFPATYSRPRMADRHLQHGGLSCFWWLPQTHWRCPCLLEGTVRKDRLRYKILSGILESKSQAWLFPGLPLCESGHQTLHVSSSILEVFSARDVCTVPDTARHMLPWRNSHDTQCSHGLLWEQFPEHLQPPMQMLVSFSSHKPLSCTWTDRPGMQQTEGRVT